MSETSTTWPDPSTFVTPFQAAAANARIARRLDILGRLNRHTKSHAEILVFAAVKHLVMARAIVSMTARGIEIPSDWLIWNREWRRLARQYASDMGLLAIAMANDDVREDRDLQQLLGIGPVEEDKA